MPLQEEEKESGKIMYIFPFLFPPQPYLRPDGGAEEKEERKEPLLLFYNGHLLFPPHSFVSSRWKRFRLTSECRFLVWTILLY